MPHRDIFRKITVDPAFQFPVGPPAARVDGNTLGLFFTLQKSFQIAIGGFGLTPHAPPRGAIASPQCATVFIHRIYKFCRPCRND